MPDLIFPVVIVNGVSWKNLKPANPQKLLGQKAAILMTLVHKSGDPQPTKE